MLTDDDLMIVGGLGDTIDVELISTEEILDYVKVVGILLLILRWSKRSCRLYFGGV